MRVTFNINFHTVWGQTLYITGSIPELGNWDTKKAYPMQYLNDGNWSLTLDLPDNISHIEYRYFLNSNDRLIFEEWQHNHKVDLTDPGLTYLLFDYWQNRPQNLAYYSSAFTKSFFAHPCDKFERVVKSDKKITIKILAPQLLSNQSLAICGNQDEFGNWDAQKALILGCETFPLWTVEVDASNFRYPVECKFLVLNDEDKSIARWENGENRSLNLPLIKENETAIISGLLFRDNEPDWKCAGLVIPVFSLRSSRSFGIGDFGDLKDILDWVKKTSQRIIQVLPVNDTTMTHTWLDSYPYNAITIYALHPLYLNLQLMGTLKDPVRYNFFREKQVELNAKNTLDYEEVDKIKWLYFQEIYEQEGENVLNSEAFKSFFTKNKDWLIPYAAFSYLRNFYHSCDFNEWGEYSKYNQQKILQLCDEESPVYKEIAIFYFIQFHLHVQLSEVRDYAYKNGIVLKGDIPIGISKTSIEAWTEPHYFNMEMHAGAPPDDFSINGQNWNFPTYNWDEIEKDNFSWWKKRFRKMSDYFDAYRIDHILGFFRIWEIPAHSVQGIYAYFNPSLAYNIQEIENAGLTFDRSRFTTPHINEKYLPELFGGYTNEVKDIFLENFSPGFLTLKKSFNSQLKIQHYFSGRDDLKSQQIKNNLFIIANEVLFIPDVRNKQKFYPRISASSSYIYKELSNADKYAFDFLYWDYFYHRNNEFWKEQGYKHLTPLVSSTDMLVCGEDLGMIPQSVPEVMHKLQILSLEIERMPKEVQNEFTNLKNIPYLSVCMTSTHDMSTIRGWWKEDPQKIQRYYNNVLGRTGIAPIDCTTDICRQIICNHLNSPAMLAIIPLQDWLSADENLRLADPEEERINVPANPRNYWRYRMHLTIEELLKAEELNNKIINMIENSGRK